MGNYNSTPDLSNTANINNDSIFKVDNINSHGCKHSSAKIQVSDDSLCIHQKHRQSLFIPLDTIKRYGLDDSIFILECGRRAPLGPARYAFRCKQARDLVDCLDQRITMISNQLLEHQHPQQDISLLSLTNVSSTINNLGRIQSAMSLSSATSFYRNSEPDLSENYFVFRNENDEHSNVEEINYAEFTKSDPSVETASTIDMHKTNTNNISGSQNNTGITTASLFPESSITKTKSYVYIDHEKTTTLKEITQDRLQQHPRRIEA
ncbi:unnamed protein product [Adineta steineri]|uniref:IRS-type PTB domain-containing protein n=1 Tax=Adineta steineri TaxID=433720 RepID=A0A818H4S5_9BILA|nr:unnamed protein product [Adineta steineri]CAF1052167.1 unnamed protein product [Adineta steineri]CAF1088092.1 unnamed protein product [Adineta steineri]CAF1137271.1 unnamed protein product [Adineta steineri]CAF1140458.1 unnamed protein product [Adineta steineri]